jgi:hypothetical protein
MTNQSKESFSKQQRNMRTPPKRWFKIVDKKNKAKAVEQKAKLQPSEISPKP